MKNQYRKKPVVISATQWFKDGDHPNVVPLPPKVSDTMEERAMGWSPMQCRWIGTLEGGHIVVPGDWIITGVQGEQYPCKPDIFAATYEPAALQATPQPSPTALELMREYSNGKQWALEEVAKEFDRRAVLADGSPAVGWYEPGEPAQIVRNIALKGGA